MPPKVLFTREEILNAALDLVRRQGSDALTARALAQALGSSPKPIFGLFQSMEQLQQQVLQAAHREYTRYLRREAESGQWPPYKATGLGYIRFAREEKELFKLLFMRDRSAEAIAENQEELEPILAVIQQNTGLDRADAYLFHLENWVYVHGIATMLATSYLEWDMEFVSQTLTDIYLGLKHRFMEEKNHECH